MMKNGDIFCFITEESPKVRFSINTTEEKLSQLYELQEIGSNFLFQFSMTNIDESLIEHYELPENIKCYNLVVDKALYKSLKFIEKAVKVDGYFLKHASEKIKKNEEVVFDAIRNRPEAYKYSSQQFKDKYQFGSNELAYEYITRRDMAEALNAELAQKETAPTKKKNKI